MFIFPIKKEFFMTPICFNNRTLLRMKGKTYLTSFYVSFNPFDFAQHNRINICTCPVATDCGYQIELSLRPNSEKTIGTFL
jgi:hypothetical protein